MIVDVTISTFKKGQEQAVFQLIKKVYDEFVAKDYSRNGNRFFYNWIKPSKIAERQELERSIFIAEVDSKLVGMIEIRDNNRISLLFVDKNYHGQGIARKLFNEALRRSLLIDPLIEKYFVHASPYSIQAYKKLGFVETDRLQEQYGIIYLPMEINIKK